VGSLVSLSRSRFSIVYDPKAKDNEHESAKVFQEFTRDSTIDQAGYISDLIEATAGHCTEAHMDPKEYGSDDVHFFLDFDMAILGAERDQYEEYREAIREEYSHIDDAAYKLERAKALSMFLKVPNIFATQQFRDRYEQVARENIQREIQLLQS
jgi:predicted metal-dependent HD superfamily phosphohydrolase